MRVAWRIAAIAAAGSILSACGAGSAIQNGGPVTSLASIVEHKGTVPEQTVLVSRLNVPRIETGSLKAPVFRRSASVPSTFATISSAGSLGWIRDREVETYLGGIIERLQAGMHEARPVPVFVSALNRYNAFATPDGEIVVGVELLRQARTEGDIAAILAHELSHLLLRHFDSELGTRQMLDAMGLATNAAVFAAVASEMRRDRAQQGYHYNVGNERAARSKVFRSIRAGQWAVTFVDDIVANHYSREHEFEADMLGIDLLGRSGYQPIEAKRMLEFMLKDWEQQEKLKPTLAQRIGEHVGNTLMISLFGVAYGADNNAQAAAARDGAIQFAVAEVGRAYTESHPSPGARIELVNSYIEKHYALTDGRNDTETMFRKVLRNKRFETVMRNYRSFFDAMLRLDEGKHEDALVEVRRGLSGPTVHDAGGRYVAYQILAEMDERDEAYKVLSAAKPSATAPIGYYSALSWEHAVRGKRDLAIDVLDDGDRNYKNAALFLPTRVRILRSLNDHERLARAIAACMAQPQQEVKEACDNAARGGEGHIAEGREAKGLLSQAKQNALPSQGFSTLIQGMTGAKLPRLF